MAAAVGRVGLERVDGPAGARGLEVGRAIGRGDHGGWCGVAEDVRDFAPPIEHVDGHDDRAQLDDREPQIDDRDAVGQAERDAVAGR